MQLVGGSNAVFGLNTLGGSLSMQTKSGRTFNKNAIEGSAGSWGQKTGLIESGGVSETINMITMLVTLISKKMAGESLHLQKFNKVLQN